MYRPIWDTQLASTETCKRPAASSATSTEHKIHILHVPTAKNMHPKQLPNHPKATCKILNMHPKQNLNQQYILQIDAESDAVFLIPRLGQVCQHLSQKHQPQQASGSEDTCKACMSITSFIHQMPINKKHIPCTSSQTCLSFTTIYTFSSFKWNTNKNHNDHLSWTNWRWTKHISCTASQTRIKQAQCHPQESILHIYICTYKTAYNLADIISKCHSAGVSW